MAKTRYYETTIVINGALEEENITQIVDRTTDFITRNGGVIKSVDHWGRRRLAYPINKKHTGYYVQYGIEGPLELSPQMERFFHLEEHIIRHLAIHLDENDLKDREDMRVRLAAAELAREEDPDGESESEEE